MSHRTSLRPHVIAELAAARAARSRRDVAAAWHHLERAHILSQPSPWLHTRVHGAMLLLALRVRDLRELIGQLVRLPLAGVGSAVRRYPVGNTGRARVSLTRPMLVPADLQAVLIAAADRSAPTRA